MSANRYTVTYDHGPVHGELDVWSTDGAKAALENARRELRRRRLPQVASHGRLRIARERKLNPGSPALDRDERDVIAQLEIAGAGWKYFESDGDAYEAALRLIDRGLVKRIASGQTETRPVRRWIEIAVTKQGLLAAANRAPDEIVVLVTAAPHRGVREMVVRVDRFEGVLAVHPSLRNSQEIELATEGKPQSWGITHVPSGQLVATVSSLPWARRLAKEIMAFADEGITSTDPRVAALAIGGPGMVRARYIGDVSRQARSRRGTFPTFASWRKTNDVPSAPPPASNPRTYSFIKHSESPTLVLGHMGWPQIWSYRGTEIRIDPPVQQGGRASAVVSRRIGEGEQVLWHLHAPDVHSALRAAKLQIDVSHARAKDHDLGHVLDMLELLSIILDGERIPRTRQNLARAVKTAGSPYTDAKASFERKSLEQRMELLDFVLEQRALVGLDPWPRANNPRTYSFIKHDESPTLVVGQMGWPQIWSYRGGEIDVRPHPGGHLMIMKVSIPAGPGRPQPYTWAEHVPDAASAVRAAKMHVDLVYAGQDSPRLWSIINALNMLSTELKQRGVPRTRQNLARAIITGDLYPPTMRAFEGKSVAERLEFIDFILEYRALLGLDPWPTRNPRRRNPDDLAGQAAVAAALGALIGGVIGAAAGGVIFGAAGVALGAMASGGTGATTGLAVGAVFGIPLGAYIGTIWGAVRQTGRVMGGRSAARRTKVLAGVGAAVTGPLAPVGAAVGAYLGAPSA